MKQFILFGMVGISNTMLSYCLNIGTLLLLRSFSLSGDYYIANIVAFTLSVLWSYYWNSKYVFIDSEDRPRIWWKVLLKTYASYAISGLILTNIFSYIWIDIIRMSKFVAPLINLTITVPLNYLLNKFWTYN